MNQQLQLFNFNNQQVRTTVIDNKIYFVGRDVAEILGYSQPSVAISKHIPDKDKGVAEMETPGGKQKLVIISEPGLYRLAFKSHAKNAEQFNDFVATKILPTIREKGVYMTDEKAYDITHDRSGLALADLLQQAADQLKQKDIQIAEMKPKALFADAVATSNRSILVGELAKLLRQNGIEIGQNRLFNWLRENGYLIKRKGSDYNMPTQRAVAMGLFQIKETSITHSNGVITISKTPKVTGKGQQYFINKFLRGEEDASSNSGRVRY